MHQKIEKIKMPWQGMSVMVIIIVNIIISSISSFYLYIILNNINIYHSVFSIVSMIFTFIFLNASYIIFGGILAVGFWKGWKWSVHVLIFFAAYRLINEFFGLIDGYESDFLNVKTLIMITLFLILYIVIIYLSYIYSKHPFYNQGNKFKLDNLIKKVKSYAKKNREDKKSTVEWS